VRAQTAPEPPGDAAQPPAAPDAVPSEDVWQQPFERMEQRASGPRSARHTDAHADRVIVAPTAETHPKGTLFLTAYEVVLPSVGYAFTDRLQGALTGLTDGDAAFFDFTLKANVLRSRWLRVATHASVDVIVPDNEEDDDDAIDLLLGRAGGTAQLCFELACRSSFSLSLTLVAHDAADTVLPVGVAAGFTARVSEVLVLLLEYSTLLNASRELPVIDLPFYLLSYGMRLTSDPSWSLDLALMRVLEGDTDLRTGELKVFDLLGIPLLVFTYRFL
jgi:hypothetical protein